MHLHNHATGKGGLDSALLNFCVLHCAGFGLNDEGSCVTACTIPSSDDLSSEFRVDSSTTYFTALTLSLIN